MKGREQIQHAHDLLHGIVTREVASPFAEEHFEKLEAAEDVLCWILDHTHNQRFSEVLQAVARHFDRIGVTFVEELGPLTNPHKKPM